MRYFNLCFALLLASGFNSLDAFAVNNSELSLSGKPKTQETAKPAGISFDANDINSVGQYVQNHPNDPKGHLWLARSYEILGYGNLAMDECLKASALDKNFPDPLILLIRLKFRTSDPQAVKEQVLAYQRQFNNNADALFELAMALRYESSKLFEKASFTARKSVLWTDLTYRANEYGRLADDLLKSCQKQHSNLARVAFWRANTLYDLGDYNQAVAQAKQALTDKQLNDLTYSLIARCYKQMGQMKLALQYAQALYKKNPGDIENSLLYAETLSACGRSAEAMEAALFVMGRTIGNDPDKLNRARKVIVQAFKSLPATKRDKIIDKVANDFKGTPYLGRYHLALGDLFDRVDLRKEAIREYKIGVSMVPNFARGYLRLAEDQENWQYDFEAAKNNYEKAFSIESRDPEIDTRTRRFLERYSRKNNDLSLRLKLWLNPRGD